MALWWIGNALFILVVIPVVIVLLQRLVSAVLDIGRHINTVSGQVQGLVVAVDDVKQLIPTRDAVKRVGAGLTLYVQAVDRIL